ncbi:MULTISPECIES: ABC transporter substrate-binding protein [Lacrimispora]|uniref:ABC transporter substrate-binding protein n=1 Tax=Lacrimispora TaxID=2719231 RepID=UPI000BE2B1F5|nr:ABC transporter substrate-binding protein [Lacrimispora amygdalina]MDK2966630.1 pectin-derived oligosaccharide transport system substrate-binding protein [Lacrimispora sp.]
MKKRILATSLAAILAATSLAACGSKTEPTETSSADTATTQAASTAAPADTSAASGDKISLSLCWWGNQTRNDVTKKAVDLYMSKNPNVDIKVEFTDWSGYWDKLSAMAAGGNLPDIIQMDYSYLNQYQKSGQLADLSEFMSSGLIDTSKIPESIIKSGNVDGKTYAISLGSNAPMMVYDKAIVEKAGVTIPDQLTMDELYDISKTIDEKTGVKTLYDGGINMMQIMARANGSHLFDELSAGKEDSLKIYFNTIEKFAKSDSSISADLLAEKNPDVVETKPIIDGTTWNDLSLSNQFISITNAAGRDLAITMFPTITDAKEQPLYLKPSMFFSVAETSKNKEEAAKFLDWFTNSTECNEILLAERGIPINTEVADAIKTQADPTAQAVFDYVAKVTEIATPIDAPDPSGKGEVEALGKTVSEAVRYGDATGEDAVGQFVPEAKNILEQAAK